ncbi:hypothetical protein CO613_02435 [Lysobacteraceae bacterium NML07-0707]|nr:hypothetical protein CO613_02435 [Xanthomonadaceae bacterium NML07-0707]
MKNFAPILATLRRSPFAASVIALQIALACAVLVNALDLIAQRYTALTVDSGVHEAAIGSIHLTGFEPEQAEDVNHRIITALQQHAGVQAAGVIGSLPFGQRAGTVGLSLDAEGTHHIGIVDLYVGSPGSFDALGLRLVSGRLPQADEYAAIEQALPKQPVALLTRSLAEHIWPGESALGKQLGRPPFRMTVIGVVEDVSVPMPGSLGAQRLYWSIFVPAAHGAQLTGNYVFRADPAAMPAIQQALPDVLAKAVPEAVLTPELSQPLSALRQAYFANDRNMLGLLLGIIAVMLGITAFGIVGLASFWVQQRTRQIGIRRALGATRGDILRYFQSENFLIVTGGIVLGLLLAFGLNQFLMAKYELPRLPWQTLPIAAVVLWLLGQLAVLAPALRAAAIPPATATRSV